MDVSHTSSSYGWNDSNMRHIKYESCSPISPTTATDSVQPISLATPAQHPHRHPYHHHHHHHHLAASTCNSTVGGQCIVNVGGEGVGGGGEGDETVNRMESPLGGQLQQLNFATNNNELEMDCGEATVAPYVSGGGLVAYRTAGGLSGIGRTGGNVGIGNSNRISRQDPLSHRIIEKRRRDRMNNCLADLSRLIPAEYLKKGRGRVEKTEIIEMAIMHMKYLQHMNHYSLGYQDCMSETLRFLVEVEGQFPRSPLCVRLLAHLQQRKDAVCVRRGSGGSTSSTSHSPVGGCGIGGNTSMAAMMHGGGDDTGGSRGSMAAVGGFEGVDGGNGTSITPIPTLPPTPNPCNLQQQSALSSSPASTPPSSYPHAHSPNRPPSASSTCTLQPPKLEPNNNDENYQHAPCTDSLELDEGDRCSALDETDEHLDYHHEDSKCSLRQRVQQIQLEQRLERHSEGYKYKNDIKLRFTKDVIGSGSRRDSNESTGNHSSVSPPLSHHNLTDICQQQSVKLALPSLRSPDNNDVIDIKETSFAIPIFALHNKGSFYVPLTVDYRALLPYLNGVNLTTWSRDSVLHPVAINVNFQTAKELG